MTFFSVNLIIVGTEHDHLKTAGQLLWNKMTKKFRCPKHEQAHTNLQMISIDSARSTKT